MISVAMCTYNGSHFLEEQLKSIRFQKRLPDELVVCDDGSTDSTVQILDDFRGIAPFEVRILRNELNLGPTRNFEKAITACRGQFIALCDQDDIWLPGKLMDLSAELEKDPSLGGIFSDGIVINEDGAEVGRSLWRQIGFVNPNCTRNSDHFARLLLKKNVVTGSALMIRRDLIGHFFPIPDVWMHDAWIAFILILFSKLAVIEEPLIHYRVHGTQAAGIRSSSLRRRIARSLEQNDGSTLEKRYQAFQALTERIIGGQGLKLAPEREGIYEQIELAKSHLQFRLSLSNRPYSRVFSVISRYREYEALSGGVLTMGRDILRPHQPQSLWASDRDSL
jgi:glycosyltransferase involved in cell wall biosynthesis